MSNVKKYLVDIIWTMIQAMVAAFVSIAVLKTIDHIKGTDIKNWIQKVLNIERSEEEDDEIVVKGFIRQ